MNLPFFAENNSFRLYEKSPLKRIRWYLYYSFKVLSFSRIDPFCLVSVDSNSTEILPFYDISCVFVESPASFAQFKQLEDYSFDYMLIRKSLIPSSCSIIQIFQFPIKYYFKSLIFLLPVLFPVAARASLLLRFQSFTNQILVSFFQNFLTSSNPTFLFFNDQTFLASIFHFTLHPFAETYVLQHGEIVYPDYYFPPKSHNFLYWSRSVSHFILDYPSTKFIQTSKPSLSKLFAIYILQVFHLLPAPHLLVH